MRAHKSFDLNYQTIDKIEFNTKSKLSKSSKPIPKNKWRTEFAQIFNDIAKIVIVYIFAHTAEVSLEKSEFLSKTFVNNIFYFAIGTIIYHIIFKKSVVLE